jgi:hypothetical protein
MRMERGGYIMIARHRLAPVSINDSRRQGAGPPLRQKPRPPLQFRARRQADQKHAIFSGIQSVRSIYVINVGTVIAFT